MSRRLHRAIRTWLRHERTGADERAERALTRVFSRLTVEGPAADFAARVLAGAGFPVPAMVPSDLRGLRWKGLAAACWMLAAAALTFVPSIAQAMWVGLESGKLLEFAVAGLVLLLDGLTQGWALIETLARALETIGAAFASPTVLAMIASSALLSLLAFRFLQGLLVSQRSTHHA